MVALGMVWGLVSASEGSSSGMMDTMFAGGGGAGYRPLEAGGGTAAVAVDWEATWTFSFVSGSMIARGFLSRFWNGGAGTGAFMAGGGWEYWGKP